MFISRTKRSHTHTYRPAHTHTHNKLYDPFLSGEDPEILKRGGVLCQPPCFADKENVRFQVV